MKKCYYEAGEWKESQQYATIYSPQTNEAIAEIPQLTVEDVNRVINTANETKEEMGQLTALERAQILEHIAQLFEERKEEAAKIISLESAKPLKFALIEIDRTIETYKFAAEEAKRITGEIIPMDAAKNGGNRFAYTVREPLGVIGAITPFNFPQNLVAHKVGPAIASGNTIVLKPASQTTLSALLLADIIDKTDLPKGAFNIVTGSGSIVGNTIVENPLVKMITFTGSPEVGVGIRNKAGLRKVALELGSNAGLIIDSNVDIDNVVQKSVVAAFSNQGQVCISLQRVYVMKEMFEQFITKFKEATENLIIGDPLNIHTDLSAMIHPREQQRAMAWVNEAVEQGANVITGGTIDQGIFKPTILTNVNKNAKVSCSEVFAPIVIVHEISSIEEGIKEMNDSDFGLQAGIFTNDIKTAFHAAKKLEVGGVLINDIPTYRVDQMPYGGIKLSGTGKEGLKYAINDMLEHKLIIWNNN